MTETPPMTERRRRASYASARTELTPAQRRRLERKHGRELKRGRKRRAQKKLEAS